ncbi:MAG: AmmeMemoRadiSam system protein B, partial [Acidobacteriota bacterium]
MLPRLRPDLDFMPSPMADRPGLLIRDPFQFSSATLVIPKDLVQCLTFFDGEQSTLDLRHHLVRLTGDLSVGELEQHLIETLSQAGFLEDDKFAELKDAAHKAFAEAPLRLAQHAGSGYPDQLKELRDTFDGYLAGPSNDDDGTPALGIAAPHVSPFGGVESYRAAYASLQPSDAERTFGEVA